MNQYLVYSIAVIVCLSAGFIGSAFTSSSIDTWYNGIEKPSFNPPDWIFGPVWTVLYILMGISAAMIFLTGWNSATKLALGVFAAQLVLNTLWSILFFGLKNPGLAFAEIVVLWLAIAASILLFYRIRPTAAYLLVPYILWVSFAAVLNFRIMVLN